MDAKETTLEERAGLWVDKNPIEAYCAGISDASLISFHEPAQEILRFVRTENGFDIKIAEGITMTEAAEKFINVVKTIMEK